MNQQEVMVVGIAAILFVLVALFTPVGASFLTAIGLIAFLIYKARQKKS